MPELLFDRKLLDRRRARAARNIGGRDFLLRHVADEIAARLTAVVREFPLALNLGAHNGALGSAIRRLPNVGLVADADPSPAMLEFCGPLRVACEEDCLPFRNASLDLVVSGLALHLVNDLPGALIQIRRALRPDGLCLGAVLGGRTLTELRESLMAAESAIEGGASPRVSPFADVRDYGGLLQRAGFALPVADAELLTVTYQTPLALMQELRAMGAANVLVDRSRKPLRRATLVRAAEYYSERFPAARGRVTASFEVIYLTGWAPHESQQRPLRPGSATQRLADALGTPEIPAGDKANPRGRRR